VRIFNAPLSYAYLKFLRTEQKLKTEWLEAGILAGICEEITNRICEAREIACKSEGKEYCEIIIEFQEKTSEDRT
jgi:hypothetical protein